jgi:glycosyltransferase involved in cell wall biosynthesis
MPLLSIIIPTLNSGLSLRKAIGSILSQTLQDWELLVVDGGSSDNTLSIAQSYNDRRIRVIVGKDKGIYDAMNKGIANAYGEWLYFLGSDDYLLAPTVFELMLSHSEGADMLYGDVQSSHLGKEYQGEWSYNTLPYNRCHQAIFYRHRVFDKIGTYPLKYVVCADHYINLRTFLDRDLRTSYCPIEVAYHAAGGYSSKMEDPFFDHDIDHIILRYGKFLLPKEIAQYHCQRALAHHCSPQQRIFLWLLKQVRRIV